MNAEILIRAARAVDAAMTANSYQEAVDEGHDTPENSARRHWDASSLLRRIGERFLVLADQHAFAAKRMERAQREEVRTGQEYRAGDAA